MDKQINENNLLLLQYAALVGLTFLIPSAAFAGILSFVWMLQIN